MIGEDSCARRSPREVCPDTGLARHSYGQARALPDERTAPRRSGTGWNLHEYRRSALTSVNWARGS
ncbi:hypothetical protein [Streptomyces sp. NPDC020951]|uniref:hypothetical protein n=1 Tax=Streptomyces sp. NPDC020951 TaxID=3365104 RepID=UPI0037A0D37D